MNNIEMRTNLQTFIKNNPNDWQTKLTMKPYNLKIAEKDNRVLFKYNQIESDFSNPIVKESRGIILDKRDWSIVAHPLHKFFNYGESEAAEIDWDSARVMEKKDGSLIKLYYYEGEWRVATNGTIDAVDAELQYAPNNKMKNFEDLFYYTLGEYVKSIREYKQFFNALNKEYTYLFELCTPYNRVVVPYTDFHLFFITSKNNETGFEIQDINLPIEKIPTHKFLSLENVVYFAENLPFNEEGYVVDDGFLNRVKVKSPAYLAVHRLKGDQQPSPRRIFDMILEGEEGEFLSYFPEYKELFDMVYNGYKRFELQITADVQSLFTPNFESRFETRKEFALKAKETTLPGLMFYLYDNGGEIALKEYLQGMNQKTKDYIIQQFM